MLKSFYLQQHLEIIFYELGVKIYLSAVTEIYYGCLLLLDTFLSFV